MYLRNPRNFLSSKLISPTVLQMFKIVLLISLRGPTFQKAKSIPDLLNYFCKGDPDAIKIVTACSKYIFNNAGKDLVFLFDGLDKFLYQL